MVSTFQPGIDGTIIAKFVLPHAEGNAAAMYLTCPSGFVNFKINMCSANQSLSRPMTEAIRNAKHFFPNKAFPPYPDPKDQTS